MATFEEIELREKLTPFSASSEPKILGEFKGLYVTPVNAEGELVLHLHRDEDGLVLVVKRTLLIEFRDRAIQVGEYEFLIVPRRVERRPVARFDPAFGLSSRNAVSRLTHERPERLRRRADRRSVGACLPAVLTAS